MTQSPRKAFSHSAQLAKTPITAPKRTTQPGSVFWVDVGKKSLVQEASYRAKSLAGVANDCHCLAGLFLFLPSML